VATSPALRLATEADVALAATGTAVASWYRALHDAGRTVCAAPDGPPAHLRREADELDAAVVREMGERLRLSRAPGWSDALDAIEPLKRAMRALPETLTYGDFHWTNLALARALPVGGEGPGGRAVVFDYHLLGVGPAEGDVRNVVGALAAPAREAFLAAYGAVDERALLLDAPVASLHALREALRRPSLPRWGEQIVREVESGTFLEGLRRALAVL
jgi:hypothetical protein